MTIWIWSPYPSPLSTPLSFSLLLYSSSFPSLFKLSFSYTRFLLLPITTSLSFPIPISSITLSSTNTSSEDIAWVTVTLLLCFPIYIHTHTLVLDVATKTVRIYTSNKNLTSTWWLNGICGAKGVLTETDSTGWQIRYIYFIHRPKCYLPNTPTPCYRIPVLLLWRWREMEGLLSRSNPILTFHS